MLRHLFKTACNYRVGIVGINIIYYYLFYMKKIDIVLGLQWGDIIGPERDSNIIR